jgi:uncharacterized membrane protein
VSARSSRRGVRASPPPRGLGVVVVAGGGGIGVARAGRVRGGCSTPADDARHDARPADPLDVVGGLGDRVHAAGGERLRGLGDAAGTVVIVVVLVVLVVVVVVVLLLLLLLVAQARADPSLARVESPHGATRALARVRDRERLARGVRRRARVPRERREHLRLRAARSRGGARAPLGRDVRRVAKRRRRRRARTTRVPTRSRAPPLGLERALGDRLALDRDARALRFRRRRARGGRRARRHRLLQARAGRLSGGRDERFKSDRASW